ncbi:hypothetical protein DQ04_00651010 [Trypanosoma grayi]|uniref:hypothetical protein n=1 Tax=Trypanosoma grayi TaxID=71804 RepID=UPI0004F48D0F|nr:hypothetical protein DQ04_00651010 [Trypanosoma grayi]KEG14047.1 hypothetical protein DQ04_00651010 [Trypanosoma grayi]
MWSFVVGRDAHLALGDVKGCTGANPNIKLVVEFPACGKVLTLLLFPLFGNSVAAVLLCHRNSRPLLLLLFQCGPQTRLYLRGKGGERPTCICFCFCRCRLFLLDGVDVQRRRRRKRYWGRKVAVLSGRQWHTACAVRGRPSTRRTRPLNGVEVHSNRFLLTYK